MTLLLLIKSIIVLLFLAMFLRRPSIAWGIGLLTVTSAVLLDTFLGTFGPEETAAELGFFYNIITGVLFGGGALWLWGILRPYLPSAPNVASPDTAPLVRNEPYGQPPAPVAQQTPTAFDRQMLYDEIRLRLGRQDILDLIFDLSINENDVILLNQDMNQLIINLMDTAETNGQTGALALAVERILTPLHPDNMPRLEKINPDSPPTILRHYLLAHYDLASLQKFANDLGIDWEQLGAGNKKEMVRNLLLYLYRRNRIDALITYMQNVATDTEN